jgi:hypothetical protein
MLRRNAAVLATMHRVQRFFDANDVVFAEINASGARQRFDQAANDLAAAANEQEAAKQKGKGETLAEKALRAALLKQMRPVVRIAQCVLDDVPELSSMTMAGNKTACQPLMEAAAAMADVSRAYRDVFRSGGLPADFVEQLTDRMAELAASFGDRDESVSARVLATASTASLATRARRLVKVLDALVKQQLSDTDPLLASWQTAKRYHAIASRPPAAGATVAAEPAVAIAANADAQPVTIGAEPATAVVVHDVTSVVAGQRQPLQHVEPVAAAGEAQMPAHA